MKKSPIRKTSKAQIPKLKRKLWSLLSLWIRQRDNFTCFTCGRKGDGGAIHAGHCIPKSICGKVLQFDPLNLAAQCYNCNINSGGNGAIFAMMLKAKYGYDVVEVLNKVRLERRGEQWTPEELLALIICLTDCPEDYEQTFSKVIHRRDLTAEQKQILGVLK